MSAGMTKPWLSATQPNLKAIPMTTGVFEVRNAQSDVLDIDYAGSRELFGLHSAITRVLDEVGSDGLEFRYEVHIQYQSRYVELVLNHRAHNGGQTPERVANRKIPVVGRLSPDA